MPGRDDTFSADRRTVLAGSAYAAAAAVSPAWAAMNAGHARAQAPTAARFNSDAMAAWAREWTDAGLVQGYARRPSVIQGEHVELCISSKVRRYTMRITRVGAERRLNSERRGIRGMEHPIPADAAQSGCGWPVSLEIPTADLRPGYYEVALLAEDEDSPRALNHAFFIVRPRPGKQAAMLLGVATHTEAAYNTWGGPSLYDGATRVSLERPLDRGFVWRPDESIEDRAMLPWTSEGEIEPGFMRCVSHYTARSMNFRAAFAGWFNWEMPFVRWAERQGFELDLATNSDLADPDLLAPYRVVLSVGHDEYWTMHMREGLEHWVRSGGRLAAFSGNTCGWQVRREGHVMVCYKESAPTADPVAGTSQQHLLTSSFVHPWVNRSENQLLGVGTNGGLYARAGGMAPRSSGGYTVWREDHWALAGTALQYGDSFGIRSGIAGYEAMGCRFQIGEDGLPVPLEDAGTPPQFEIIASVPALVAGAGSLIPGFAQTEEGFAHLLYGRTSPELIKRVRHGHAVVGAMHLGKGEVFTGSSTNWAYAIQAEPVVERIALNVLRRFLGAAPSAP